MLHSSDFLSNLLLEVVPPNTEMASSLTSFFLAPFICKFFLCLHVSDHLSLLRTPFLALITTFLTTLKGRHFHFHSTDKKTDARENQ